MISIVTVVRNDLSGIISTFNSIHKQNFRDFEWVVVDALSTDGTIEYIKSINTDIPITFRSEKDNGIYDGMNKGILLSKRKYIIFLNAGDYFVDSQVLKDISQILIYSNYDIVYGSVIMNFGLKKYIRKPKNNIKSIYNTLPGHHQATFYNTNILKNINYNLKYEFSGDYYISAAIFSNGYNNWYFTDRIISEFEVGHHSYLNAFKIWRYTNDIQLRILKSNYIKVIISSIKRLLSTFGIIVYMNLNKLLIKIKTK
jgi:putative colanic acid biosynthesis glycosyltransferase